MGLDGDLAAATAVRTGRGRCAPVPDRHVRRVGPGHQSSYGTRVDALAAEFTVQRSFEQRGDVRVQAAVDQSDRGHALDLIADAHALAADDALFRIPHDHSRFHVARHRDPLERQRILGAAVPVDQVLEPAVAPSLADRALHAVVQDKQLQLLAPRFDDLGRVGLDLHPALDRCRARRHQPSPPVTPGHDAQSASAVGGQALVVAQGRHVHSHVAQDVKQ